MKYSYSYFLRKLTWRSLIKYVITPVIHPQKDKLNRLKASNNLFYNSVIASNDSHFTWDWPLHFSCENSFCNIQ